VEEIVNEPKTRSSFFRRMMRFFLWLIVLILIGIAALLGLLYVYQDEVKAGLITELNKQLNAEVKIDPKNIDLTIIKTFPDCSIEFKDLLMLEALPTKQRDTLLFAGRLNLFFNIEDLWNKNYEIEKIRLTDAVAKLKVLKNGKNNYTFWKENKQNAGDNDSLKFNLKLITIENCRLIYRDRKNIFKTELDISELEFKGQFNESAFVMETKAKILIHEIAQRKTSFLKEKSCEFSFDLDVNDNSYTFKKATINLNKLALELKGKFSYTDSLESMDVKYSAPDLEISSVLSLLPEKFKGKINDYESTGNFYAQGNIYYLNKNSYSLVSDFGIKKGQITYKPTSTTATDVNVDGHINLTNAVSVLVLKNISVHLNADEIKGNCAIRDFSDPYLQFAANANVKLENLQSFWPIDTLTSLKGELKINAEAEGLLKDLKEQTFSTKVKLNLEANVSDLEAQFKNDEKLYSVEHCFIKAKEREIEVKDLRLKRGSSDIVLNGKIPGVFNYIMDRTEPLSITGSLYSNYINVDDFVAKGGKSAANDRPLIPANIHFKLNAAILKFSFGKFNASSITGEIEFKNQKAIVSDVKLETLRGSAEIDAFADNSKNKLDVVLQSKLNNIDVTELFTQMNNFGQTTLQDQNIKGVASSTIEFSGSWNNRLEPDPKSIYAICNINIDKGELIDFKPLLSLSRFVDIQDLKRIKFSSLQSKIEIKNSLITIPHTTIKNSALNIDVWGTHTFNNEIDYHIQLLISELLAKKRKRTSDDEFGIVESDPDNRRSAFILMTGTIDNPIIKYDKKGFKEKFKNDIKQEKQTLKRILKEELGFFKKDSVAKKDNRYEKTFEFEELEKVTPKKTLELKKKKEEDDDF
jgi:hypothetical protein